MNTQDQQDNYQKDVIIRKQQKEIEKLQQEVNALKVAQSGISNNQSNSDTVMPLSFTTKNNKSFWQGNSLFNKAG